MALEKPGTSGNFFSYFVATLSMENGNQRSNWLTQVSGAQTFAAKGH